MASYERHEQQQRRPTMADVASHVGVSKALVSIVFRDAPGAGAATRDRVLRGAAELGYRPDGFAQGLRKLRSRHLGVLFTMRSPFECELVEHIYEASEEIGYRVVLGAMTANRRAEAAIEELISYRSEALLLVSPCSDREQLDRFAGQLPVVEIGRASKVPGVGVVRSDDAKGTRDAVDHLVGLGHHQIVHVDGGSNSGAAERKRGYRTAMRRRGLNGQVRVLPGDYTEEAGANAAAELLRGSLPTAVLAGNDQAALGVLDSLRRAGVDVPGQVSVVGFDDSRFAQLPFVNLTSVRQNAGHMAELAVRAAVQHLEGGPTRPADRALTPELVVRETTAPPSR